MVTAVRFHKHFTQKVPSDPYWPDNCSAYSLSMLIMDETVGGLFIPGADVRAISNEPVPDHASPGLNIQQLVTVAHKLRVYLDDKSGETWPQLVTHVKAGARAGVQIDYASLGDYRCQANGNFGHMGVIVDISGDGKNLTMSDPLCSATKSYPVAVVRKAAETFAHQTGQPTGVRFCTTRVIPKVAV